MPLQRIRDPLHNLIEFQDDPFERLLWRVIQTRPFQRLRRIKQLGFSELVYPGATHTRFGHSLGVFYTARLLMQIVRRYSPSGVERNRVETALAAALLHDVGHGPFSHAFETVAKRLDIATGDHENTSDALIRGGEIADVLKVNGSGFAADVADLISHKGRADVYSAVVSSQFDADRLDYMRRDRLMTGTQHGAIDFDWLISNLEIGEVSTGVDQEFSGTIPTFVLGPKAIYAAETYLLSLFQLYPTVYFHKATRGAEAIFSELFYQVVALSLDGSSSRTGLPHHHPLIRFALKSDDIENFLALDDTTIWGSLDLLSAAEDKCIAGLASILRRRELLKCIDLREQIRLRLQPLDLGSARSAVDGLAASALADNIDPSLREALVATLRDRIDSARIDKATEYAYRALAMPVALHTEVPTVLLDQGKRRPYKPMSESSGPQTQILIRSADGNLPSFVDVASVSRVVASIQVFKFDRAYIWRNDKRAEQIVNNAIEEGIKNAIG